MVISQLLYKILTIKPHRADVGLKPQSIYMNRA